MDITTDGTRTLRIAIVTGTRPGRLNEAVAHWVLDVARRHGDAHISLLDVGDYRLRLATATPPLLGRYAPEHLDAWSRTVGAFDGFVFVTPEYNAASSAVLTRAIDLVASDWRRKAVGFVGYGAGGAVRAVDDLRRALVGVGAATVVPQVSLTLVPGLWKRSSFMPDARHAPDMSALLERVIARARALQTVRLAVDRELVELQSVNPRAPAGRTDGRARFRHPFPRWPTPAPELGGTA